MAPTDRYCSPVDLPEQIPVFPLRGVILLPRATLPLSVFEPRYLEMLEDVLAGQRVLGIIQPERSEGDDESPAGKAVGIRNVGCVGRLTAFQELAENRMLITLTGIARFDVVAEMPTTKPYRVFQIDCAPHIEDFQQGAGEEEVDRTNLLRVLKSYLEAHKLKADWRSILSAPTEYLVNSLSIVCPYGAEEKQALLEAKDLKTRAEVLMALAEMELASNESGSGGAVN